jgi:hypothetical protein
MDVHAAVSLQSQTQMHARATLSLTSHYSLKVAAKNRIDRKKRVQMGCLHLPKSETRVNIDKTATDSL